MAICAQMSGGAGVSVRGYGGRKGHFGVGALPVAVGGVHVLDEDSNWTLKAVTIVEAMDQGAAG